MLKRKVVSGIMLTLLFMGILTLAFSIQGAESSEPPVTEWTRTYGGASDDFVWSVVETVDGGYALAGDTRSFGAGSYDFWLVKTNSTGSMEWNQTYGGASWDESHSIVQTGDGGYALAGDTRSFGAGSYDFWLVKVDSSGNVQWNKTYGGANDDTARSVVETGDGGYALAGYTRSSGAGDADGWLVKVDSSGNVQWNKTYGGYYNDWAYSVVETGDGGYALTGDTLSFGAGLRDSWLVRVNSLGDMLWNKTYGGQWFDETWSGVEAVDGGYALAGFTSSFGAGYTDFWLIKVDSSGNIQWTRTYGGANDDFARSVVETGDGGYALAGDTRSFGAGSYDFWLVKVDSSGNVQWNKTYGGANDDTARSVVETGDGGYALAGDTYSFGAGSADFWLVKVSGLPQVGGIWIPADKLGLLAPYLSLTSTIILAIAATAIYIKYRKKRNNMHACTNNQEYAPAH